MLLNGEGNRKAPNANTFPNFSLQAPEQQDLRDFAPSPQELNDWMFDDFRKSAVPDGLTLENVQALAGEEAQQYLLEDKMAELQKVNSYVTEPVKRLRNKYKHVEIGGWGASCGPGYFKPIAPRVKAKENAFGAPANAGSSQKKQSKRKEAQKAKRQKNRAEKPDFIKYENAPGQRGTPLLPLVDLPTALDIYKRYGVELHLWENACDDFWSIVHSRNLPIVITEGLKKALSLLAHGIPAIAIRGITMWHPKGTYELHPELRQFATKGRAIYIAFDQDTKPKTIRDVSRQVVKLGTVLEEEGCTVGVPVWSSSEGKGVDDVLYAKGENAQTWLSEVIEEAFTLGEYRITGRNAAILNFLRRSRTTRYAITRDTVGLYAPELPEASPGTLEVLNWPMESGKTTRLGIDRINKALAKGHAVIVLVPLNSLGKQAATDFKIIHVHDRLDKDKYASEREMWDDLRKRQGIVLCPDSINALPSYLPKDKPLTLILDEANQVTAHITGGETLKEKYGAVLEKVEELAKRSIASGGNLILSEDGIPDYCINFWKKVSGAEDVRYYRHRKEGKTRNAKLHKGSLSGFRGLLQQRLSKAKDAPLLCLAASLNECKAVERIAQMLGLKACAIHSQSNEGGRFTDFFDSPDQWIEKNKPDVLILSPSVKAGVSIQGNVSAEDAYFKDVWAYFPALDTDTHMQMLGRYRPNVPLHIFVPPFIMGDLDERLGYRAKDIKEQITSNSEQIAKVLDIKDDGRDQSELESAIEDYRAESRAVSGSQKSISFEALRDRLECAGHQVSVEEVKSDKEAAELWKTQREIIWAEESDYFAGQEPEENQDTNWAYGVLNSTESSYTDRLIAHKVLLREQFPGENFNDSEDCYRALFENYGALKRGAQLQARAEHLEAVKVQDKAEAERILNSPVRARHRMPLNHVKAAIIAHSGILDLLDETWSNSCQRAIALKQWALRYRDPIKAFMGLNIQESQTPSQIISKLIKKLGFEKPEEVERPGGGNTRDRVWRVAGLNDLLRQRLLEASRRKLSGASTTSKQGKEDSHIRIHGRPSITDWLGRAIRWGSAKIECLIEEVKDGFAVLDGEGIDMFRVPISDLDGLEFVC